MKFLLFGMIASVLFFAFIPGPLLPSIVIDHDKMAHAFAFSALALMVRYTYAALSLVRLVLFLGALGALIEVVQYPLLDRSFSVLDFCCDIIGIALFIFLDRPVRSTAAAAWRIAVKNGQP